MIGDEDNDCRWQATVVVGEYIPYEPEFVWQVICDRAADADDDMLDALATVLLEHLLGHSFEEYFARVRSRIEAGDKVFRELLERCFAFGEARDKWEEVTALLRKTQ